jgi:enterochelin esterase-like enzyme
MPIFGYPKATSWETHSVTIPSKHLERNIVLTIYEPYKDNKPIQDVPLLLSNDGQDFAKMSLPATLLRLHKEGKVLPVLVVGMHCNENRINEYGTASQADYKNRGNKATQHTKFVLEELLPYLTYHYGYKGNVNHTYFMGFSLGGLSAMDIVWHHPDKFSKVGAFSPSFWWRQTAYEDNYQEDNDRIMHNLVRNGHYKKGLKFWFEVGTEDEKEDRNNNGIIDAIDDVMDMMKELEKKGYKQNVDFVYDEIQGGKHDVPTWERALPPFLEWLFKK